jgi:maltose O-acetyltransferase
MTEREKMLAGQLYDASGAELSEMRRRARALTRAFNATTEDETEERRQILGELFGRIGEKIEIEPPFRCDYGSHIFAGENFYANFGVVMLDCAAITFGDNVLLAPNVQLYTAYHPVDPTIRASMLEAASPITIGTTCGSVVARLSCRVFRLATTPSLARAVLSHATCRPMSLPPEIRAEYSGQ